MKRLLPVLLSVILPLFCFSQDSFSVNLETDSLFIKLPETTIGNQVLIDKINIYGDSLNRGQNGAINFLFTTKGLMMELIDQRRQIDSLKTIVMPGGPRPIYGLELTYFSMDFKTVRERVKYFNEKVGSVESAFAKNSNLDKTKLEKFRQQLFASLHMPLTASFFAKKKYFENKEVFVYKGTTENLNKLRNKIEKAAKIFILLPLCGPIEFDYHVLQVIENFRYPRL